MRASLIGSLPWLKGSAKSARPSGRKTATDLFSGRLGNRALYGAMILLTFTGLTAIAYRFFVELDASERLLTDELRARSVALEESLHIVRVAVGAVATELRAPEAASDKADVARLMRIAYNARGTSDIAAFDFISGGARIRYPEGYGPPPAWLVEALPRDGGRAGTNEMGWTPPLAGTGGDRFIANVASAGPRSWVAAEVDIDSLSKYTIPAHAVDVLVSLIDDNGRIVLAGDSGLVPSTPTPAFLSETGRQAGARLDALAGRTSLVGGQFVALFRIDGPGWYMAAQLPAASLAAEAARATLSVAIAVSVALALLWAGAAAIEVRLLRPARAAGRTLAETLGNLQITFEAVSDGIALMDKDRRLLACNDRFISLLALPAGEEIRIGAPIPRFGDEDGERSPEERITRTSQFRNPDGRWIEARLRGWDQEGRPVTAIVLTDVTERLENTRRLTDAKRQAEEALARLQHAQTQLVEAEKLAALGGLVAGVAHEINTPIGVALSAATSLAELTRQFLKDLAQGVVRRSAIDGYHATMKEAVSLLERNLGRASELIRHFKQVAIDRTSAQRRKFDLREVVGETVATLYPVLKRTPYAVTIDIPAGIELDGYPGPLGQVVTNLVTNALAHAFIGRDQGTIAIRAERRDEIVLLSCKDDGIGMDGAIARRVFEPFFTTRRGSGGSGLGMHIVYSLVTGLMGGEIGLDSQPGHGTTVRIELPLIAPEERERPEQQPTASGHYA